MTLAIPHERDVRGRPAARSLVNNANNATPPGSEGRAKRYKMRDMAGTIIGGRTAQCGKRVTHSLVELRRTPEGGAHYHGVQTCGSVWTCPICAVKIAETRRQEVGELLDLHTKAGGTVYMAAFTIPHHAFQGARELRDVIAAVWRGMANGNPWQRAKGKAGCIGYVKALEVTHGKNGWHPHLHVLFFLDGKADELAAEEFGIWLFEAWAKRVAKRGYGQCNPAVWRFERAVKAESAGDYVAKWGCAAEMTSGHTKLAKGGGRSPWQMLADAVAGDRSVFKLFEEYARAFKGARQLTWSRNIRRDYGLADEVSDEDAAATEPDVAEVVVAFGRKTLGQLVARGLMARLLDVAEEGGRRAVWAFMDREGVRLDGG